MTLEEKSNRQNRYAAEFIGSFALLFIGCGAIIVGDTFPNSLDHVGISLCFGLVVMAMIYAVGNISGAHFNPAVTIGFYAARRLPFNLVVPYIVSQLAGAFAAALLLRYLFIEHSTLGATLPQMDVVRVFIVEVILTFVLMFVILNVSTGHMEKGIMAGVAVGGTVGLEALVGGPISGASMNPARSIAPAIVSGEIGALWLYIAAPVLGALLAQPTCRLIQGDNCCDDSTNNDIASDGT